jgi:hypothetical protein
MSLSEGVPWLRQNALPHDVDHTPVSLSSVHLQSLMPYPFAVVLARGPSDVGRGAHIHRQNKKMVMMARIHVIVHLRQTYWRVM